MAGVDSAAPLEDVDLQTTEEIDAKRGTLDPLDEAALQAARPATIEIPVTHVFAKDKVAMYCAYAAAALLAQVSFRDFSRACSCWVQMSNVQLRTDGFGPWPGAIRSSSHSKTALSNRLQVSPSWLFRKRHGHPGLTRRQLPRGQRLCCSG